MLLMLTAILAPAWGQDVLSVWGGYQPPAATETDFAPTSDIRFLGFGGRVLTPPLRFADGRVRWANGLRFAWGQPRLSAELPDTTSNNMVSLMWEAIVLGEISERWKAVAMLAPGLHSNFAAPLSGRDFKMQAVGVVTYQTGDDTLVGLGFGYANLFGVPRPFPVLQASTERARWRASMLLPQQADIWYELVDDRLSLGAQARLSGGTFHRGNDDPGRPDNVFIRYSLGTISPAVEARAGGLRITGEVGYAARRRFNVYQGNDPLAEFDIERGWTARVTLGVSPDRNRKQDVSLVPGL